MIRITCIITSAGTEKNLPLLYKCILSLRNAREKNTLVTIIVTTENQKHCIGKVRKLLNTIIVCPKYSGFVGMNNTALTNTIHTYPSDYYLFINDDAWIENDFFSELSNYINNSLSQPDVCIPLIYEMETKTLDSFGVEYFRSGYSKNSETTSIETTLASMSCLLIKTSFLKKILTLYGYFLHPLLAWYLDDVEFSLRALASGANFHKCEKLIVHHYRTFTWGRKSFFVMYQSFRNIIWIILLTWPKQIIKRNVLHIFFLQSLIILYSLIHYGPFMYPKIIIETIRNWKYILRYRRHAISKYKKNLIFDSIFSKLTLRSKYGTL